MQKPLIPSDEIRRLEEVHRLGLLYTNPEQVFDRIVGELARVFDVPVATMSLVDREALFFKAEVGLGLPDAGSKRVLPRDITLCGHVVGNNDMVVVDDLSADDRFLDNPIVMQSGARFYAGTPLRSESGHAVGSLCIIDTKPRHISEHDRRFLEMVARSVMTEISLRRASDELDAISRRLAERNREMEDDLERARAVQRFLLPPESIEGPGWRVGHRYQPLTQLGGDFFDVCQSLDGGVAVLLADVCGHGSSAALISAMVKTSFQRAAVSNDRKTLNSTPEVLSVINRDLAGIVQPGRFVTAIAAAYEPARRMLSLSSAGHPHPLLVGGGLAGPVETESEIPLALDESRVYEKSVRFALPAGACVLMYTDGAIEAANSAGAQLGVNGLMKLAIDARGMGRPAALNDGVLIERLLEGITRFAGGRFADDVTLAAFEAL